MKLKIFLTTMALGLISTLSHAITIEEVHELQKEKLARSLKEGLGDSGAGAKKGVPEAVIPQQPVQVIKPKAPVDETANMRLTGLYGVGDDVTAIVMYNGNEIDLRKGDKIAGWTLTAVGDRWIDMSRELPKAKARKAAKSKKNTTSTPVAMKTNRLRIATAVTDYSRFATMKVAPASNMVPPIPISREQVRSALDSAVPAMPVKAPQ